MRGKFESDWMLDAAGAETRTLVGRGVLSGLIQWQSSECVMSNLERIPAIALSLIAVVADSCSRVATVRKKGRCHPVPAP
jgi:hypothetical protein